MRVPIGCFVLMAVCFSAAQTSQEFHSKYGEPDIERFTARPGIGLTVEFGPDGLACHNYWNRFNRSSIGKNRPRLCPQTRSLKFWKKSRQRAYGAKKLAKALR